LRILSATRSTKADCELASAVSCCRRGGLEAGFGHVGEHPISIRSNLGDTNDRERHRLRLAVKPLIDGLCDAWFEQEHAGMKESAKVSDQTPRLFGVWSVFCFVVLIAIVGYAVYTAP
jgi:hypothetical protein